MDPSGTGSVAPLFDDGAASVVHRPIRTGSPPGIVAVGKSVSERMHERPAVFTPVTIRRTFPGIFPLRSRSGDLDVEQRRVLLRPEEIALAHAAARAQPAKGELDGVGGLEHDEVGHPALVDTEEARDRAAVAGAAVAHPLEVRAVAADDVERDVIDAGVLAANGRGELDELHLRGSGLRRRWFRAASGRARAGRPPRARGSASIRRPGARAAPRPT